MSSSQITLSNGEQHSIRTVHLREQVSKFVQDFSVNNDISIASTSELCTIYMEKRDQFISPRPRNVHIMETFSPRSDGRRKKFLDIVLDRISRGEDITANLSPRVFRSFEIGEKSRGISWKNRDLALNFYDIHHLHIDDMDKSYKRSRNFPDLIWGHFTRNDFYAIYWGDHDSLKDEKFIASIATFWDTQGYGLHGICPSRSVLAAQERQLLQRYGFSPPLANENNFVGSGIAAMAGNSLRHQAHLVRCFRYMRDKEKAINDGQTVEASLGINVDATKPEWVWAFDHCDLVIMDKISRRAGVCVPWR